eukprot:9477449-Pyramimonas_sp.AAC.2
MSRPGVGFLKTLRDLIVRFENPDFQSRAVDHGAFYGALLRAIAAAQLSNMQPSAVGMHLAR